MHEFDEDTDFYIFVEHKEMLALDSVLIHCTRAVYGGPDFTYVIEGVEYDAKETVNYNDGPTVNIDENQLENSRLGNYLAFIVDGKELQNLKMRRDLSRVFSSKNCVYCKTIKVETNLR